MTTQGKMFVHVVVHIKIWYRSEARKFTLPRDSKDPS
jgi:hypothetical protein